MAWIIPDCARPTFLVRHEYIENENLHAMAGNSALH